MYQDYTSITKQGGILGEDSYAENQCYASYHHICLITNDYQIYIEKAKKEKKSPSNTKVLFVQFAKLV